MTQSKNDADIWGALRFLLGTWSGRGSGKPGESHVERMYELVLNQRFIQVTDRSTYEPQEKNPEGEAHEELGFFSYDRDRDTFILREFHAEGFVNQYVLESVAADGKTLVFQTEAMENMPSGWEARTTYTLLSNDHFIETFELRQPDGDWSCLITSELRREQET